MAAHSLLVGALTWLALAVTLASSVPCCPEDMPLVPFEDAVLCQDNNDPSIINLCYSYFTSDVFKNITGSSNIEVEGFITDKYCTGTIINSSWAIMHEVEEKLNKPVVLVCFPEEGNDEPRHYTLYATCLLISSVFLFATLVFYVLLPELRDLQGKCVIFLVVSLMLGSVSLAIVQLPHVITTVDDPVCVPIAMFTYFWLLSAFFWLNINCFNIWRSSVLAHMSMSEQRLMQFYHIAGWGFPVLFLLFAVITHHIPGDDHIKPNFGVTSCWFQDKLELWVYFYTPVLVLLILNFIYFISTARMLWQEYRAPNPLPRVQRLRFKFCLYLKLFLAMGITWIFEVISAICDLTWYVTDIFNCLQGVVIFLVMIALRKRVWHLLAAKRLCGVHNLRCFDQLVDEETLEGPMDQPTTVLDDTRVYELVEDGNRHHPTNSSG